MDLRIVRVADDELKVAGEIDLATGPQLEEALQSLTRARDRVVVDLSEVSFLDSSGLRILVSAARSLHGRGSLVLRRPSPFVIRVLEISGLDRPAADVPLEFSWDSVARAGDGADGSVPPASGVEETDPLAVLAPDSDADPSVERTPLAPEPA